VGVYAIVRTQLLFFSEDSRPATKTALFLVSGLMDHAGGSSRLSRIGGMVRTHPYLAVLFLLSALSLAGIPPFSGFVSKFALIDAGIDGRHYPVVAVSLVVSLLTLFAMIRIWTGAFWSPAEVEPAPRRSTATRPGGGPALMVGPTAVLVACSIAVAVAAGPLYRLSERTARDLLQPQQYVEEVLGR
jgi:multicomponent Na+:H+ antiporter subunit D